MRLAIDFVENDTEMEVQFIQTHCDFCMDFGEITLVRVDKVYDGEYDVIPRVYQQILETKDKLMLDDVTVQVIPLVKTINQSNGYTVTIG